MGARYLCSRWKCWQRCPQSTKSIHTQKWARRIFEKVSWHHSTNLYPLRKKNTEDRLAERAFIYFYCIYRRTTFRFIWDIKNFIKIKPHNYFRHEALRCGDNYTLYYLYHLLWRYQQRGKQTWLWTVNWNWPRNNLFMVINSISHSINTWSIVAS